MRTKWDMGPGTCCFLSCGGAAIAAAQGVLQGFGGERVIGDPALALVLPWYFVMVPENLRKRVLRHAFVVPNRTSTSQLELHE